MISFPENPHSIEVQKLLHQLGSDEEGISDQESKQRLAQFGLNEIPDAEKKPIWKIVLKQFNNLMVYILLAAALISFFTKHYISVTSLIIDRICCFITFCPIEWVRHWSLSLNPLT